MTTRIEWLSPLPATHAELSTMGSPLAFFDARRNPITVRMTKRDGGWQIRLETEQGSPVRELTGFTGLHSFAKAKAAVRRMARECVETEMQRCSK